MRTNPFQALYDLCNSQDLESKRASLPESPRYVDVELTNTCNFNCFFCPTGTGQQRRAKGFMAEETFRELLRQVSEAGTPLRFIRWGEPLLHPRALDWIGQTLERGLLAHVTTNGSLLDDEKAARFCDMGLHSIKFSFQGAGRESYVAMRNRDFFDQLLEKIAAMHHIRGGREKPFIHASTTITSETPEQVAHFRDRIRLHTDSHQIGRTVLEHIDLDKVRLSKSDKSRLIELKEAESVVRRHAACHQVFDVLSVNWDGSITSCCRDYDNFMIVGHVAKGGMQDAWNSPRQEAYRSILAAGGHDRLPLCKTCYDLNQLRIPGVQCIPQKEESCTAE